MSKDFAGPNIGVIFYKRSINSIQIISASLLVTHKYTLWFEKKKFNNNFFDIKWNFISYKLVWLLFFNRFHRPCSKLIFLSLWINKYIWFRFSQSTNNSAFKRTQTDIYDMRSWQWKYLSSPNIFFRTIFFRLIQNCASAIDTKSVQICGMVVEAETWNMGSHLTMEGYSIIIYSKNIVGDWRVYGTWDMGSGALWGRERGTSIVAEIAWSEQEKNPSWISIQIITIQLVVWGC